jgi:hypothetical protein
MKKQIETLKKMQVIELEAGFPNGELYNELEDKIWAIKAQAEIERRKVNGVSIYNNQFK